MVGEVTRIVQVAVRHCRAVDAVRVTYMRKDREESSETELWGGKGGMTTVVITFLTNNGSTAMSCL